MRKISISNYRNIGIDAPAELKIPQDGGLIVLLEKITSVKAMCFLPYIPCKVEL